MRHNILFSISRNVCKHSHFYNISDYSSKLEFHPDISFTFKQYASLVQVLGITQPRFS